MGVRSSKRRIARVTGQGIALAVVALVVCAVGSRSSIAATISFGNGSGFAQNARDNGVLVASPSLISNGSLALTTAVNSQTRSVYYNTRLPTANWTASFTYQYGGTTTAAPADGFAFVVQNAGTGGLGDGGGALGYGSSLATGRPVAPSAAVVFTLSNGSDFRAGGGGIAVGRSTNGGTGAAINFRSTTPVNVTLSAYNDRVITQTISQGTQTYRRAWAANFGRTVGANAYFGFTGATGGFNAAQTISNFTLTTGVAAPPAAGVETSLIARGDPITAINDGPGAGAPNSPGAEGAPQVIDADPSTKYLNFNKANPGFVVTPSIGASIIHGFALIPAADAGSYPQRDPATISIYGSNDGGQSYSAITLGALLGSFDRRNYLAYRFDSTLPSFTTYKVVFPSLVDADAASSMQIADFELLGTAIALVPEPSGVALVLVACATGGALRRRQR